MRDQHAPDRDPAETIPAPTAPPAGSGLGGPRRRQARAARRRASHRRTRPSPGSRGPARSPAAGRRSPDSSLPAPETRPWRCVASAARTLKQTVTRAGVTVVRVDRRQVEHDRLRAAATLRRSTTERPRIPRVLAATGRHLPDLDRDVVRLDGLAEHQRRRFPGIAFTAEPSAGVDETSSSCAWAGPAPSSTRRDQDRDSGQSRALSWTQSDDPVRVQPGLPQQPRPAAPRRPAPPRPPDRPGQSVQQRRRAGRGAVGVGARRTGRSGVDGRPGVAVVGDGRAGRR